MVIASLYKSLIASTSFTPNNFYGSGTKFREHGDDPKKIRQNQLREKSYYLFSPHVLMYSYIIVTIAYGISSVPKDMVALPSFWGLWMLLVIMPCLQISLWRNRNLDALYCIINMGIVMYLERSIDNQHTLMSYFFMNLLFRAIIFKDRECLIAATLSYMVSLKDSPKNFTTGPQLFGANNTRISTSQVCAAICCMFAFLFEHIYQRIYHYLWDIIHLLVVIKEKTKHCQTTSEYIVSSHFSPIVMEHIFGSNNHSSPDSSSKKECAGSLKKENDGSFGLRMEGSTSSAGSGSMPTSSQWEVTHPFLNNSHAGIIPVSDDALRANLWLASAISSDIIYDYSTFDAGGESANVSYKDMAKLGGLTKRYCVLIAIKICEKNASSVLHDFYNYAIFDVIDEIAAKHKVVHLRNFGNVWIGCLGFFNNSKDPIPEELCYEAVMMACDVSGTIHEMSLFQVSVAIDANEILGGFVNSSHDMFGPEIRWVCRVAQESQIYDNKILVSLNVKKALSRSENSASSNPFFDFTKVNVSLLASNHTHFYQSEEAFALPNATRVVIPRPEDILMYRKLYAESSSKKRASEYQNVLAGTTELVANLFQSGGINNQSQLPPNEETGIETILQEWIENLSTDFLSSCPQNYTFIYTDPIIQKYSDEEYLRIHTLMRNSIFQWVYENYFRNPLRFIVLFKDEDKATNQYSFDKLSVLLRQPLASGSVASPFVVLYQTLVDAKTEIYDTLVWMFRFGASESPLPLFASDHSDGGTSSSASAVSPKKPKGSVSKSGQTAKVVPIDTDLTDSSSQDFSERIQTSRTNKPGAAYSVSSSSSAEDENVLLSENDEKDVHRHVDSGSAPHRENEGSPHLENEDAEAFPNRNAESEELSSRKSLPSQKSNEPNSAQQSNLLEKEAALSETLEENANRWSLFRGYNLVISSNPSITLLVHFVFISASIWSCMQVPEKSVASPLVELASDRFYNQISYVIGTIMARASFDRSYDRLLHIMILAIIPFIILKFPTVHSCMNGVILDANFGDLNGESLVILAFIGCMLVDIRRSTTMNFISACVVMFFFYIRKQSIKIDDDCGMLKKPELTSSLCIFLFEYLVINWTLEFMTYSCYVIKNTLLASSLRMYCEKLLKTRTLLQSLEPLTAGLRPALLTPHGYVECPIISVSMKAAVSLPGILKAEEFESFYSRVRALVNSSIKDGGLMKVAEFGGTFIMVISREFETQMSENIPISYPQRALFFLNSIQQKVEGFTDRNGFSIELDVGIDYGPATIGMLGAKRHCFDISGYARDLSFTVVTAASVTSGNPLIILSDKFIPGDNINDFSTRKYFENFLIHGFSFLFRKSKLIMHTLQRPADGVSLDDFVLESLLGKGAYGSVHLVREIRTAKLYAIKVIPQQSNSSITNMARKEFLALQQLQHPNVITFKFCLMANSRFYLVMEYAECGNLRQVVEKYSPPIAHLMYWFAQLVLALEYIHSLGIIHRDVKPANCMVGSDGNIKLGDFGLCIYVSKDSEKLTATATLQDNELRPETLAKLKKFLPLKAKLDGQNAEALVDLVLFPIKCASFPDYNPLLDLVATEGALYDMLFPVTTMESFEKAQAEVEESKALPSVVLIELLSSFETIDDAAGNDEIAASRTQLLNAVHETLERMTQPRNIFAHLPVIVLVQPGLLSDEEQKEFQATHSNLKLFLTLPLQALNSHAIRMIADSGRIDMLLLGASSAALNSPPVDAEIKAAAAAADDSNNLIELSYASSSILGAKTIELTSSQHLDSKDADKVKPEKLFRAGTPHYMAPEIVEKGEYSIAVDWWACGVTFYFCVTGQSLFQGTQNREIFQQICAGDIALDLLEARSQSLGNLVSKLLTRNVTSRIGSHGVHHIKQHPFFGELNWRTFRSDPPFRPPPLSLKSKSNKNATLFYGRDYIPRIAAISTIPKISSAGGTGPMKLGGAVRRSKSKTRFMLARELNRFNSISAMRDRWMRLDMSSSVASDTQQSSKESHHDRFPHHANKQSRGLHDSINVHGTIEEDDHDDDHGSSHASTNSSK